MALILARRQSLATILVLVVAVLTSASSTTSAEPPPVAGIVIEYGNGATTYALIPLQDDDMSGIDLLELSGIEIVTVDFGGLGDGVCKIREVGCDPDPCRATLCQGSDRSAPFWQYLQADPSGVWKAVALGAGSSHVMAGTVDAWYWTGKTPTGPAFTVHDLADRLDVDLASLDGPVSRTFGEQEATPGASKANQVAGAIVIAVSLAVSVVLARRFRMATA